MEQLYDLRTDPNEQINLIDDELYSEVISEMQWLMREYIASTCPMEDGECLMPSDPYTDLMTDDGSDLVYSAASTFGEMDLSTAGDSGSGSESDLDSEEWPTPQPTKKPTSEPTKWPTSKPTPWPTDKPSEPSYDSKKGWSAHSPQSFMDLFSSS